MLPAVVCFVSMLCTASLASFGMDAAAIAMSGRQQEDVARVSEGCLLFNELFAAVAILVCILYYAVVKLSLMAMGAVIMAPPDPHPLYARDEEQDEQPASPSTFSVSGSEEGDAEIKAVFPASDAMDDEPAPPAPTARGERFSAVKIWTNVYGLSVGIYCLVYSLLLPSELSAFVFCAVSLAAGVHEALTPCLELYLREDRYEMLGDSRLRHRRRVWLRAGCQRQAKRCLGWLCLIQSSVARELTEAAAVSLRRSRARARRMLGRQPAPPEAASKADYDAAAPPCRASLLSSGVLAMPCLIAMLGAGLACKVLEAVLRRAALEGRELPSLGNATAWEEDDQRPLFDEDASRGVTAINVLFPVVGVLMLKSMRKADNVRETIEVAVPVCGLNSLCIVCVILMQGPACMLRHLAVEPVPAEVAPALPVLNASGVVPLHGAQPRGGGIVIARYQPILAALALPFPLVCSVVCIVAAVRNHRVMDIAVSIFLAYASRQFVSADWLRASADALPEAQASASMGGLALALGAAACMALAAYRMAYGDDHGHAHGSVWLGAQQETGGQEQAEGTAV